MRYWKPSRAKAKAFAETMDEIADFCFANNIVQSSRGDSYYFSVNGQKYRVSNHSAESSTMYHPNGRDADTIYIHASKTRIREIYKAITDGLKIDGRGYVIDNADYRSVKCNK